MNNSCDFKNDDFLSKDPFSLFGITPSFDIDISDIKDRYYQLQLNYHPDHYSGEFAHQYCSYINECYQALINYTSRAVALLKLHNITIDLINDKFSLDAQFLQLQMELHQKASYASTMKDIDQLKQLQKLVDDNLIILTNQISKLFCDNELSQVKILVYKMSFLEKFKNNLHELISQIY